MIINLKCSNCGEALQEQFTEINTGGVVDEIQLTVEPHECKPTEKSVILSDAITAVDGDMVELGYFKKDGSFVTMTGYFKGGSRLAKIGYEFFMKAEGAGFVPRNLIRRGITSVYHVTEEFTYIIK